MSCTLLLNEIAKICQGEWVGTAVGSFMGVSTDTRKLKPHELFFALRGENFDGHQFIQDALKKGAVAVVAERGAVSEEISGPILLVDDSVVALQKLAQFWRRKLGFKVLAITGSNGKTTTKEFAQQLLSAHLKVHSSRGSFNNHLGVPLSLLEVDESIDFHIQEMGMNALGEIAHLCSVAEPNVVVCTMVGSAHIGELGSQEAVAQAKEEIYSHSPDAQFIFNLDNEWTRKMFESRKQDLLPLTTLRFSSFQKDVDVFLRAENFDPQQMTITGHIGGVQGTALVEIFGRQNVVNLMAACCLGLSAGLRPEQIWQGLSQCKTSWGRNQWIRSKSGFSVLFDAYNANPESMRSLLTNLFETKTPSGRHFLVLGEMKELGDLSAQAHFELGALAAQTSPEAIWYVGHYSQDFKRGLMSAGFDKSLMISDSYDDKLAKQLTSMLGPSDIVAVKASRALKLERLLEGWSEKE